MLKAFFLVMLSFLMFRFRIRTSFDDVFVNLKLVCNCECDDPIYDVRFVCISCAVKKFAFKFAYLKMFSLFIIMFAVRLSKSHDNSYQ